MSSIEKAYAIYMPLTIGALASYGFSDYGGIFGCLASILGIIFSKTIIFLFLSFINFSLSIAFDNFIRADPVFFFYDGTGTEAEYLCLVSTIIYCIVGWLDMSRPSSTKKKYLIDFKFPDVSRFLFLPLSALTLGAAFFIITQESFVLSSSYDAYELNKYPFLEYFGLVIAFMLQSAKKGGRKNITIAYAVTAVYILVCLATSYRMVTIICTLSALMITYNKKEVSKLFFVFSWLISYVGLTYISYWRVGHYDIELSNIFGYFNGRMDNTFTGVIETALIYTSISKTQGAFENLLLMFGAILPLPNSLIPDSMLYIVDAMERRIHFPGGGALAGFIIYFNYLYFIPYIIYFYISFKRSHLGGVASGMYLIIFITITRWSLYGPYVIFKFLGVLIVLMIINRMLKNLERPFKINTRTKRPH